MNCTVVGSESSYGECQEGLCLTREKSIISDKIMKSEEILISRRNDPKYLERKEERMASLRIASDPSYLAWRDSDNLSWNHKILSDYKIVKDLTYLAWEHIGSGNINEAVKVALKIPTKYEKNEVLFDISMELTEKRCAYKKAIAVANLILNDVISAATCCCVIMALPQRDMVEKAKKVACELLKDNRKELFNKFISLPGVQEGNYKLLLEVIIPMIRTSNSAIRWCNWMEWSIRVMLPEGLKTE